MCKLLSYSGTTYLCPLIADGLGRQALTHNFLSLSIDTHLIQSSFPDKLILQRSRISLQTDCMQDDHHLCQFRQTEATRTRLQWNPLAVCTSFDPRANRKPETRLFRLASFALFVEKMLGFKLDASSRALVIKVPVPD